MEEKAGVSGDALILGFTAWVWLLPAACLYSGNSVADFFEVVLKLSITSGAIVLAFLTFLTAVVGIIGKQISFIVEKLFVGPTSSPRIWYSTKMGQLDKEHWYAAQERIWASPQAYKEFQSARLVVELSRAITFNSFVALMVFLFAAVLRVWPTHFMLLLSIAAAGLVLGVISWWFSTINYQAIVRVAGDIEKSKKQEDKNEPAQRSSRTLRRKPMP